MDRIIFSKANSILKSLYGMDATFRDGQYEAIEATMTNRRTLVVQRTGWGKSLVYFICTKLLREKGAGTTLVISPLLALMDNQLEAAKKMKLSCAILNSTVTSEEKAIIIEDIKANKYDLVLTTPETLSTKELKESIRSGAIKIGLIVVDEAHCISDWGHDFRLQYMRIKDVLKDMAGNVHILATTATANERVIQDLKSQFGNNVFVSRGSLTRESLSIQILPLRNRVLRLGWLLDNLNRIPGSGIIYCLTQRDCDYVSDFLNENGISALPYYSTDAIDVKAHLEAFTKNEIKAIVSTIKLGMGFDKGDISFVIHYQMPQNIVSYYQQIGRAGRNLERAYTFLMTGKEDEDILHFFIDTAFPKWYEMKDVYGVISDADDGASKNEISAELNIKNQKIDKALMFLENDGFIRYGIRETDAKGKPKKTSVYYATPKRYYYDEHKYDAITEMRYRELEQLKEFTQIKTCYSKYIANCLDDYTAEDCGKCANCIGYNEYPLSVSEKSKEAAAAYLSRLVIPIEPRKRWAATAETGATVIKYQNKRGICLCRYGDAGYGELVKLGKYPVNRFERPHFSEELVGKSRSVLFKLVLENRIEYVTCVPSLRSDIVRDFAKRLADALKLQYIDLLDKTEARPQKEMENSSHQMQNALNSFNVIQNGEIPKKVLLIDDVVDSRWTLTVCGYRLMESGCEEVYPFALADSSQSEE